MAKSIDQRVIISAYYPDATCDLSGKTGEAIEVTAEEAGVNLAIMSFKEFQKFLRFRFKQASKNGSESEGGMSQ